MIEYLMLIGVLATYSLGITMSFAEEMSHKAVDYDDLGLQNMDVIIIEMDEQGHKILNH